MTPAGGPDWDDVLDDFEAALDRQRTRLDALGTDDGDHHEAAFTPPPGLPPLPAHLVPRARVLVAAAAELEADIAARLAATAREVHTVGRFAQATAAPRPASYVDTGL